MPLCREKSMSVMLGAPFASGILAVGAKSGSRPKYMYEPATDDMLARVAQIEEVCEQFLVTLPAVALQFPLFHPRIACVLSGVKSEEEVKRAAAAMEEDIPPALWQELRSKG